MGAQYCVAHREGATHCRSPVISRLILTLEVVKPTLHTLAAAAVFLRLWRKVAIEQVLGLSIVAVVSVFSTIAPAKSSHMEM